MFRIINKEHASDIIILKTYGMNSQFSIENFDRNASQKNKNKTCLDWIVKVKKSISVSKLFVL